MSHTGPLLPTSLRALIMAATYWFLSLSLTVASGSIAAVVGCFAACFVVDYQLHKLPLRRIRSSVLLGMCLLLAATGVFASNILVSSILFGSLFGPITAFSIAEAIKWLLMALAVTSALRVLAHRATAGAILEIAFVATAFVITLSAHRNGMIHRPFFLGDFAIIRGIDPSVILLTIGCGALLALSALLIVEQNHRRLPYHFTVLGLLCLTLLAYIRLFGLPTPSLTDDLGLTGQAQNGGFSSRENPFRDGENTPEDKEAPVAVVVFRDDYEPNSGSYYFRESAYSQFNGTMLDFATHPEMDRDLIASLGPDTVNAEQLPEPRAPRREIRTTIGMLVPHRSPFGLDAPVAYQEVTNPNNLRFKRTYDAYSQAPDFDFNLLLGRSTGDPNWSEEVRNNYLQLPADPRYARLAQEIITNLRPQYANDPFAKAWSIKTYLDENGIYSLKNEHAYADDPAASFLFGDLTGYCMHFAFAATYLYRSLGIPARVGIGYSVPAENRAGGSALLIQAIHGHAWPEVYFENVGWVIIDPAPQQTLVDMTTDPQNDLQQLLGDMLRDDAAFNEFLDSQRSATIDLSALLNTIYIALLASILAGYAIKIYRLYLPDALGASSQYRASYRAILDRLSALGLHRKPGESREQFASRVSSLSPTMPRITNLHLACALGGQRVDSVSTREWAQLRHTASGELRQHSSFGTRILAIINPFSWLQSR